MEKLHSKISEQTRSQCAQIKAFRIATLRRDHAEALHDLRVGVRRLRSTLALFENKAKIRRALKPFKHIAQRSNPIRDLEVQIELLAELGFDGSSYLQLQFIQEGAKSERAFRRKLREPLAPSIRKLRKRLDDVLLSRSEAKLEHALLAHQNALIQALRDDLRDTGLLFDDQNRWHAARINCKRLRYFAEAHCMPVPFLPELRESQEALGRLRDIDLIIARIMAIADHDPDTLNRLSQKRIIQQAAARTAIVKLAGRLT